MVSPACLPAWATLKPGFSVGHTGSLGATGPPPPLGRALLVRFEVQASQPKRFKDAGLTMDWLLLGVPLLPPLWTGLLWGLHSEGWTLWTSPTWGRSFAIPRNVALGKYPACQMYREGWSSLPSEKTKRKGHNCTLLDLPPATSRPAIPLPPRPSPHPLPLRL